MRYLTLLALLLLAALPAGTTRADQDDPRLPALFERLKLVPSDGEARPIEAMIWQIWSVSDDDEINGMMLRGLRAMGEGDPRQALPIFDAMVQRSPNFAEGWNKRATVLYLMGRYDDSMKDIAKTLALEPRHFGALSGLGMCNVQLNKDKEALDAFQKALAVDPNMPGVKLNVDELKKRLANSSI
jgi:tetratricopeptide (TPR) repeat protein